MIGVIGGNGVAATNRLLQLIEKKVVDEGAYRDAQSNINFANSAWDKILAMAD